MGQATVGPADAARAGFLDAPVSPDALESSARERAEALAKLRDVAYRGSLASVWGGAIERMDALVRDQAERRERARAEAP